MTTQPDLKTELRICPVVSEMTAAGSFDLDALAAHAKDCPICKPIVQALLPIVREAVTPWPPTPTRYWRVELAADAATNPAADVLGASEHDAEHHDDDPAPIDGQDRLIVYTVSPTLADAIEAARRQARTYPAR